MVIKVIILKFKSLKMDLKKSENTKISSKNFIENGLSKLKRNRFKSLVKPKKNFSCDSQFLGSCSKLYCYFVRISVTSTNNINLKHTAMRQYVT